MTTTQCEVYIAVREFERAGEGAITNVQQVIDLLVETETSDGRFPLHYFIDDVSSILLITITP